MNSTGVGRAAETAVADLLVKQGFKLIKQNWRTRYCEIDLVMTKDDIAYCVEVKYRHSNSHGEGFEFITSTKLKQMQRAAEAWATLNNWEGSIDLLVASVDGQTGEVSLLPALS